MALQLAADWQQMLDLAEAVQEEGPLNGVVRINQLLAEDDMTPQGLRDAMQHEYGEELLETLEDLIDTAQGILVEKRPSSAWSTNMSFDTGSLQESIVTSSSDAALLPAAGTVLAEGWFVKQPENRGRAQRRFFQLRDSCVSYYVDETTSSPKSMRGSFFVTKQTVIETQELSLYVVTPTRRWHLVGSSTDQVATWVKALQLSRTIINSRETDDAISVEGDLVTDENMLVSLNGGEWLEKQGSGLALGLKKRWFILSYGRQSHVLTVSYFEPYVDGNGMRIKGEFSINASTPFTLSGNSVTIVCVLHPLFLCVMPHGSTVLLSFEFLLLLKVCFCLLILISVL